MKYSKTIAALLLIVAVVLCFTGCSNTLSRENFISEIESYGIEKTDDAGAVTNIMMSRGGKNGYYITDDKDEAGKISNHIFNRFNTISDINASSLAFTAVTEKGSDDKHYVTFACYMTFEDARKAGNSYDILVDAYGDEEDGKTGKDESLTYNVSSGPSAAETNKIGVGIYLHGDTVIFIRTLASVNDSYIFADKICSKLGLLSPSQA